MEYKQFHVEGLFGLYNHTIDFSTNNELNKRASIIMLHGKNGVGKTTILRMIEGLMKLDFSVFREVKFHSSFLKFSNQQLLEVKSTYDENKALSYLTVKYRDVEVKLHPHKVGPFVPEEQINQMTSPKKTIQD